MVTVTEPVTDPSLRYSDDNKNNNVKWKQPLKPTLKGIKMIQQFKQVSFYPLIL